MKQGNLPRAEGEFNGPRECNRDASAPTACVSVVGVGLVAIFMEEKRP